ncbi:MAG: hypothetical protein ACRDTF_09500 [Pseudonocardiaceae bacterium]
MPERIEWDDDAAHHIRIRTRSLRYPAAVDIEPDWTAEAVNDPAWRTSGRSRHQYREGRSDD